MSLQTPITLIPTVLRATLASCGCMHLPSIGTLTNEDPLPAVVGIDSGGYLLSHGTLATEVNRETTDNH
jgi:hypothetical protein